ncbi:MAG: OsmC family protein, partial [Alphaproteobacteria bacterium]|nr:OsmC family protein [Alphaproteobacteria bacterium]
MAVTTHVEWTDGVAFRATTGSDHEITMDGAPESGGRNAGARPMELVLTGLAGCASVNIVEILKKMRQPVTRVSARLNAGRADHVPTVL